MFIFILIGIAVIAVATVVTISKPPKDPIGKVAHEKSNSVDIGGSDYILEAVSDGIVVVNKNGSITFCNSAAGLLCGWKPSDAKNIDFRSVIKLFDEKGNPYDPADSPFTKTLKTGKPQRDSNATLLTQGSERHISVSISVSPLADKNGELSGIVGIMRDISEEKLAERQRSEFISTASHEMRTPVAAIEGYLALAMNDKVSKVDSKARSYLQKAHESAQHLGTLFQDLLTSSKAEDGRLINHPEVIEMSGFLGQVCEDLRFVAEQKHLAVEYVVGVSGANMNAKSETGSIRVVQPLYYVYADPDRIREVVTNLFDNAVKYTTQGKISVGLTGDDTIVQIYVRDTGNGIAHEDIPHLFQKFYRVDNSDTREIGGTGLGLFISRKIVELYNGRIWVDSEQGKGSTFFINLPRLNKQKVLELGKANSISLSAADVVQPTDEDEEEA